MLKIPAVNPFEMAFSQAWEELKAEVETIRLCPDCVSCPEQQSCMNCAAVTYTETGRFDGKPEYICRMNRAYREALEKGITNFDFSELDMFGEDIQNINLENLNLNIDLRKGKYALYLIINDIYFKTNIKMIY